MPALSPTMKEGNRAKWLKKEGDLVEAGEVIAEIETDKAIMEVEAVHEGVIVKILVDEGTKNVKVNDLIAIIAEEGENRQDAIDQIQNAAAMKGKNIPDVKTEKSEEVSAENVTEAPNQNKTKSQIEGEPNRVFASPLARRIAKQENINISDIQGSGPRGRIIKSDVENSISQNPSQNFSSNFASNSDIEVPITHMRKIWRCRSGKAISCK